MVGRKRRGVLNTVRSAIPRSNRRGIQWIPLGLVAIATATVHTGFMAHRQWFDTAASPVLADSQAAEAKAAATEVSSVDPDSVEVDGSRFSETSKGKPLIQISGDRLTYLDGIEGESVRVDNNIVKVDGTDRHQVLVNDVPVFSTGTDDTERVEIIADRLRELVEADGLQATAISPAKVNELPVGVANNRVLFTVDAATAEWYSRTPEDLAVMWVNNLRLALGGEPLSPTETRDYRSQFQPQIIDFEGLASWYGPYFYGRPTASGEIFVPGTMTAAHKTLPLGTYLRVTAPSTGRSVVVRVNDRGPYIEPRILDLSETAARRLGVHGAGVASVQVQVLDRPM